MAQRASGTVLRQLRKLVAGPGLSRRSDQAVELADHAIRSMAFTQAKLTFETILAFGMIAAGGGFAAYQISKDDRPQEKKTPPPNVLARDDIPGRPPAKNEAPLMIDPDAGPVPAEAIARIGSTRFRQWGEVTGLAYSPDGKWLASISTAPADNTARVWDAATGKEKLRVNIKAGEASLFAPSPAQIPHAVGFSA